MSTALHMTARPTSRWPAFWRMFVIYVAFGLALAWISPWMPGAEGGKRVLTRIWGPVLTDSYPSAGRDQITVMLLDDKDLREYGEVWPVSLGFHERRLLELLKYQPKAVFFDIVFLDDRKDPGLEGFIDAACKARHAGIPVFIGSFGNAGLAPSRTESAMLARRTEAGGRPVPCIEAAYLNMRIDGYDQSVWEYDLNVPGVAPRVAGPGVAPAFPSPAARLYQVDHSLAPAVANGPMALVWGTASDPHNLEWLNNDQSPGAPDAPAAPCSATWRTSRVLQFGEPSAPICPYQQLLPMRTLKRVHGLDSVELDEAIRHKYLIYGTYLQSNGDVVLSPYHGRIAGAFLHAMALDNLLSFTGHPKAGGDFGRPWNSGATAFTLIAVAVISALIAAKSLVPVSGMCQYAAFNWLTNWHPAGAPMRPGTKRRAAYRELCLAVKAGLSWLIPRVLIAVLFLVTIAALIGVSYYWMGLGPLVWIEYVLFPMCMGFLHIGDSVEAWRQRFGNYIGRVWKSIFTPDETVQLVPATGDAATEQEKMRKTG